MPKDIDQESKPAPNAPVVRLMVLETDEPHPATQDERGSFGQILHQHFAQTGAAHDPPLGIETDQVYVVGDRGGRMPAVAEFDGFDGVLVTGSRASADGDEPWIRELLGLLRELWTRRPSDLVFIGVCFGHQLLARLLGAEIRTSPSRDWELGHCAIALSPVGQRLFRTGDAAHVYLHQMHQDQVAAAPPHNELCEGDVQVWGCSAHTPVQGLYVANRLFTTQAHLAFDRAMVGRQIAMRVESGGITDRAHADRAAETAHLEHDGDVVAAAILRMFHFGDDGAEGKEMC
ncbi:GMP synthase [Lasiosphaeria ovina]|uniref:GMP synthase n=1 Tax=Lasiosphaeria ovina TaxID=92902 RepID=A0AAE0N9V2_9PEZI|nr:GMP synthase [Lasiosphaeria ovina]